MTQPGDYGGSYGNPGQAYGQDRIWKGEQYDPQAHLQRIGSPQLLSPGLGEPGDSQREAHPSNPQPWVPDGAEYYQYRQSAPQAQYPQPTQYAAPPQYAPPQYAPPRHPSQPQYLQPAQYAPPPQYGQPAPYGSQPQYGSPQYGSEPQYMQPTQYAAPPQQPYVSQPQQQYAAQQQYVSQPQQRVSQPQYMHRAQYASQPQYAYAPSRRASGHTTRNVLVGIGGFAVAIVGIGVAVVAVNHSQHTTTPAVSSANVSGLIGSTLTLAGETSNERMAVTVTKVIASAVPAKGTTAPAGQRLYAVQFRLRDTGHAAYSDAPADSAVVEDSAGKTYGASGTDTVASCKSFPALTDIAAKGSQTGCVVFEVPKAAQIASVKFTLDSGLGPTPGTWNVG